MNTLVKGLFQKFKETSISINVLILFIAYGAVLRIWSAQFMTSYWNDESHVAKYGRAIIETGQAIDASGYGTGLYQAAMYYITALSFYLFGVNEFAGRLPSLLVGIILIPVIYIVTYKILGKWEAIIASFLMTFSQMQLAWSNQLRPYIWMELFTLVAVYFIYCYLQNRRTVIDRNIIIASIISFISLFFHGTGILNFVVIGTAFLYKIYRTKQYKFFWLLVPVGLAAIGILSVTPFFTPYFLFRVNTYLTHYQVFLGYHYGWLGVGCALGTLALWKKNKQLSVLLTATAAFIITFALFKIHARYVRYSITAFPILYILFSAGLTSIISYLISIYEKKIDRRIIIVGVLTAFLTFPILEEKLIFVPQRYYSINADMRENPIVDYKGAFEKIDRLIEGKEDEVAVMDAWYDHIIRYLPEVENYYLLLTNPDALSPNMIVTIDKFEKVKAQYPYGVVIVENWQSMTPPELQEYIRSTLKHEFTQKTIPGNEDDPWSISVYSWGL